MSMHQIRLYNLFRREMHLTGDDAADAVYAVQGIAESAMSSKRDSLATKSDLDLVKKEIQGSIGNLHKAVYISGFLQFIAMIGTVLAVVKFNS
jgi:hypothetical protein